MLQEDAPHRLNLLLLLHDDPLSQSPKPLVLAEPELKSGHIDRTLVMRDHSRGEIAVGVAGAADQHRAMHPRHRGIHCGIEPAGLG